VSSILTLNFQVKFGIDIILDPSAITGVSAHDSDVNRNLAWGVNKELLKCSQRNREAWEGIDLKVHLFNAPGLSLHSKQRRPNWLAASNRDTYEVKVIPTQSREPHVVQGRQVVFHALFTEKRKENNPDSD